MTLQLLRFQCFWYISTFIEVRFRTQFRQTFISLNEYDLLVFLYRKLTNKRVICINQNPPQDQKVSLKDICALLVSLIS